jgi:predicted O-methyltransferase YrrM/GR25 family glycosyltransferase involved in LPS biosynthesis
VQNKGIKMSQYSQNWNGETVKNLIFLDRHSILNAIEIGSYEGLTSNYICDNLLANPNGKLICIDPLDTNYSLDNDNSIFQGQYDRFVENTEANKDKITLIRKKSEEALQNLRSNYYDLIFVDGHHTEVAVHYDGTEAFRIAKVGAYILFDDFLWGHNGEMKRGIERVLQENPNHRLLLKLNQVLIQKLPEGSKTEDGQKRYQELCCEKLFNKNTIYSAYCNLDSKPDINEHMIAELERVNLEIPIVRQRSYPWKELYDNFSDEEKERVNVMFKRTPGAIGCYYSQMEVMREALRQGKHAWVNEDDIAICNDLPSRLKIIFEFLNQHEWDVFWFGSTFHIEPTWHKSVEGIHTHPDMKGICNCILNRDWEETLDSNIVRTYGAFATFSYLVNKNRIEHILGLLERRMSISMGIDWTFIVEQPNLNCFAFNPGCIKQFDHESSIGNGVSRFSGFASLGKHWYSPSMNDV